MNNRTFLVITTIASPNMALQKYSDECRRRKVGFIVIGDTKTPRDFYLPYCDFWSIGRQKQLDFRLAKSMPEEHYARKNIGYLLAIKNGAEIILESDDDNLPKEEFWDEKKLHSKAHSLVDKGWVNVYKYFSETNIWPRGFPLEHLLDEFPSLEGGDIEDVLCPIQQGLSDEDPDVDAIYRLIMPLPVRFAASSSVALGRNSWCPFNSQNTTWFKVAFPLLYLPSYCSFRMTDIWRSFVAQRIAWACDWNILFHGATVYQERNKHDLLEDFADEMPGYLNNAKICNELADIHLKNGIENIFDSLFLCYKKLVERKYVREEELELLDSWIDDLISLDVS